jgi:hypothetical protein
MLDMRNFHLPLPEQTYASLRAAAEQAQVPATSIAREAIDAWLRQHARQAVEDEIAAYAGRMAGTVADLDPDLEAATVEHLIATPRRRRK